MYLIIHTVVWLLNLYPFNINRQIYLIIKFLICKLKKKKTHIHSDIVKVSDGIIGT
jgi:hypothetical protein